jgi:hypothetical protein
LAVFNVEQGWSFNFPQPSLFFSTEISHFKSLSSISRLQDKFQHNTDVAIEPSFALALALALALAFAL